MIKTNKKFKVPQIDETNPEFVAARELLEKTSNSVFLTGKAGTGKSTFLRHITAAIKKKYVVLAPTGIAAVNVGGQTLHSFFKIPLKPLLPDDPDFAVTRLRARLKYSKSTINLIKELDLIIIDEISMVRADIIDFIDRVLRVYTGNMRLPFGGKQMLFVGDIFQLEPVVTANDRDVLSHAYTAFYFFNARVFSEMTLVPIELNKVYRQEDSDFINLLDNIRMGRPSQADLTLLNSRYNPLAAQEQDGHDFTMTIATRRDMVDAINDRHLQRLPAPSVIFKGIIENDFPENALPTDLNLELKVGAQVVFIKNDPERRWVNGTIAVIERCQPGEVTVRTEDGEEHDVEPERWANVKYIYNERTHRVDEIELGAFSQYPLRLAWAMTIHKSQGLTFGRVIIDIGRGAFAGGQTYVALSRCRSLEGITLLNPITYRDIYVKPDIVNFATKFNSPSLIEGAFSRSEADMLFRSAAATFDKGLYAKAMTDFARAAALRPDVLGRADVVRLLQIKSLRLKYLTESISSLKKQIAEDNKKFDKIADNYVRTADELDGDGWQTDAALAQYDKALEISPDHTAALLGKASVLSRIGQNEDSFILYKKVAQSKSERACEALLGIGALYEAEGDDFNAISNLLEAHRRFPRLPEPLRALVDIYQKNHDFETAEMYKRKLDRLNKRKKN